MELPRFAQQVTFLFCPDLNASDAFYRGLLGLPLVLDQGSCLIYRTGQEAFLGFCHITENIAAVTATGLVLTLVVDGQAEVDQWYEYLLSASAAGTIERSPAFNPRFNIYHLFLRDPAGYLVEIQSFLDPSWPRVGR